MVVPVTQIPEYVVYADTLAKNYDFQLQYFGHAGDGNLHIYACSNDLEKDEFVQQVDDIMSKLYAKPLLLASQNVEDFLLPEAAELTKPLFSIPAYQFLFHPGTVDGGKYREALQLEECEYGVVRSCARGNCLFKCGDERYNLLVKTPPHKLRCYGTGGGR